MKERTKRRTEKSCS